jgi:pyruvate formate lyase activating enzyme
VARACHERGIRTVAVTAGYVNPAPRAAFFRHMDAANIDLKAFTDRFYRRICGARLSPVLDTLVYLKHQTDVWIELTTLLIPGENDSDEEIDRMTRWVAEELGPEVPMHFTAFHPDWRMRNVPPTPPETLSRARDIAQKNGICYAYTGNVHDPRGSSTYCHRCGQRLIGRDWFDLTAWNLSVDGNCRTCGAACAGVFDGLPGDWGPRRLPVNLASWAERHEAHGAAGDGDALRTRQDHCG